MLQYDMIHAPPPPARWCWKRSDFVGSRRNAEASQDSVALDIAFFAIIADVETKGTAIDDAMPAISFCLYVKWMGSWASSNGGVAASRPIPR